MKYGDRGGVKFCWNLLLAVCLVRSGVWSHGRKVSFPGESDLLFRFQHTVPIVDAFSCRGDKVG